MVETRHGAVSDELPPRICSKKLASTAAADLVGGWQLERGSSVQDHQTPSLPPLCSAEIINEEVYIQ